MFDTLPHAFWYDDGLPETREALGIMARFLDGNWGGNNRMQDAKTLTALGQSERDRGDLDAALAHYEEAAALYRAGTDDLKLAHTVRHIGDILREAGRPEKAEPCYREALDIYRCSERTPRLDLANAIRGFALLKGRSREAKVLWAEARDLYAAVGVEAGVAESSRWLSLLTE